MKRKVQLSLVFLLLTLQSTAQIQTLLYETFDSDTHLQWKHYASRGNDDWQIGTPTQPNMTPAYSAPGAAMTGLDRDYSANSTMYLETPPIDFNSVSEDYALTFQNRRRMASGTSASVEYSIDGGITWTLLNGTTNEKHNWSFTATQITFQYAAHSVGFLAGEPDVRFRFVLNSGSSIESGWLIDDVIILQSTPNFYGFAIDTVGNLSRYNTQVTIPDKIGFHNPLQKVHTRRINYFFSTDKVSDAGDQLLHTKNLSSNAESLALTQTLTLPTNLHSGTYYILTLHDADNVINELSESDNLGYVTLLIDTTLAVNGGYKFDFDDGEIQWKPSGPGNTSSAWQRGWSDISQIEHAHSGRNSWYTLRSIGDEASRTHYLESPYLNLNNGESNVLCFWYRERTALFKVAFSFAPNTISYQTAQTVPDSRTGGWDCHCYDVPSSSENVKIRFSLERNEYMTLSGSWLNIDDVYIGPAKGDVVIEKPYTLFTSTRKAGLILDYTFFNGGRVSLPVTATEFYWSADSTLDASDLFLLAEQEEALSQLAFVEKSVILDKPTQEKGTYYIIAKANAGNDAEEIWHENNIIVFPVNQIEEVSLPYSENFEAATEWFSQSSIGADAWELAETEKAFSGSKAYKLNIEKLNESNSRSHLYSPIFNLTTLNKPVLEFDALFDTEGLTNIPSWPVVNMSYTIDGGATWTVLESTNGNFKGWYRNLRYNSSTAQDVADVPYTTSLLYAFSEPMFVNNNSYQGRDALNLYKYAIDISALQEYDQVQFRFNAASHAGTVSKDFLIDNFSLHEKAVDLVAVQSRNLYLSGKESELNLFLYVENRGNSFSDSTNITFYLSNNTALGNDDLAIGAFGLDSIRAYNRGLAKGKLALPDNLSAFTYLLYVIDAGDKNNDVDKTNNTGHLTLGIGQSPSLPYLNDFEASEINGWTWYTDASGHYKDHRFRTQTALVAEPSHEVNTGEWFLDGIDPLLSSASTFSGYYLESPHFSFTSAKELSVSFGFIAIGSNDTYKSSGANLQYSMDGGNTWQVLTSDHDPNAINWYNHSDVVYLGNEPGWAHHNLYQNFTEAMIDVSFLAGQPDVKFRFYHKSNARPSTPGKQGFRLDNFAISVVFLDIDYVATSEESEITAAPGDVIELVYGIQNTGVDDGATSTTTFYWSADDILEEDDMVIASQEEAPIAPGVILNSSLTLTVDEAVSEGNYYVLHKADAGNLLHETNEDNNVAATLVKIEKLITGREMVADRQDVKVLYQGEELIIMIPYQPVTEEHTLLNMVDVTGKVFLRHDTSLERGTNRFVVKGISPGIYIVSLQGKSFTSRKKILVNR